MLYYKLLMLCHKMLQRLEEMRMTNDKGKLPERDPAGDLEAVLLKIKTMV